MKQTIEIEVPDGKRAIWKDSKVIFEDIKPKLPKTWRKFCQIKRLEESEAYINNSSQCIEIEENAGMLREYYEDKNILPSKKAAEAHLALMQLHQLRDYYRQGWVPNWNNNDVKYCITKVRNVLKVEKYCYMNYFLSFPTIELAQQFFDNFRDLIEQAGDLI